MTKRALITGITGQDGPYLAEHLLNLGYEVWGMIRCHASERSQATYGIPEEVTVVQGDLLDQAGLIRLVEAIQPDEVYNLAASSYVPPSWQQATATTEVNAVGVLRMLEAVRIIGGLDGSRAKAGGQMRFYQASSSEMFGKVRQTPQNEMTPFHPRSPYGVSKAYGHFITMNYRESFGMHATAGILFNHESPRRGPQFVTRKVTLGAARVKLGVVDKLKLGNLKAKRDWGFAGDYVRAMHQIVNNPEPTDYVIGTGVMHTVEELVALAFAYVGLDWRDHVVEDVDLTRPSEVDILCADAGKAEAELGWTPEWSFEELITTMVDADLKLVGSGKDGYPR